MYDDIRGALGTDECEKRNIENLFQTYYVFDRPGIQNPGPFPDLNKHDAKKNLKIFWSVVIYYIDGGTPMIVSGLRGYAE